MQAPELSDTQPRRIKSALDPQNNSSPPVKQPGKKIPWKSVALLIAIVVMVVLTSIWMGWQSARRSQIERQTSQTNLTLAQQFELGLQDLSAGRYDVAVQRFEYILAQDPGYPGATEKIAEAMQILFSTATPTPSPPTITPTPTTDPRPVQELFQSALQLVSSQNWNSAIESLTALRKADLAYMTTRVDGLLFISLRNRGVIKILNERNLQGGIYDLALAERFGPVDTEANNARNLARLYLYGVSFWEVDWAKAVEYFSQVASASPNLTDSSGLTAAERYRIALINYGDQLASQEDWCDAQAQYEQAQSLRPDSAVEEKLQTTTLLCQGASPSATITGETPTPSSTPTGALQTPSPSATQPEIVTSTATQPFNTPTPTQSGATESPTQTIPTATLPNPTPYPAPAAQYPAENAQLRGNFWEFLIASLPGLMAVSWLKIIKH